MDSINGEEFWGCPFGPRGLRVGLCGGSLFTRPFAFFRFAQKSSVWPAATPCHPSAEALWAEIALLQGAGQLGRSRAGPFGLAMCSSAAQPQTKAVRPQGRANSELRNVAPTSEARRRPQNISKLCSLYRADYFEGSRPYCPRARLKYFIRIENAFGVETRLNIFE